ncbi:MAG: hypothetical protein DRJ40_11745 [Thermoprotei archaeon]|nr:MAG: hypothetical protein DRJ40_11745 [Thermoprotei archaeon]
MAIEEERGRGRGREQPPGRGRGRRLILRLEPEAGTALLHKLSEGLHRYEGESELGKMVAQSTTVVDEIATKLMQPFTVPSSMVVPPQLYKDEYRARLVNVISTAESMLSNVASTIYERLDRALESRRIEEIEQVIEEVVKFIEYVHEIHIAVQVVAERLRAVIASNAPARVRPPLANVLLGYDIVE